MVEVLSARGVAKQWRDIIESSRPLRKKLFLEPESTNRLVLDRQIMSLPVTSRPFRHPFLIATSELACVSDSVRFGLPHEELSWDSLYIEPATIRANIMLKQRIHDSDIEEDHVEYWFTFGPKHFDAVAQSHIARSAFLTQPPCTTLRLGVTGADGPRVGSTHYYLTASVHCANGLTLGLITDTFEKMVREAVRQPEGMLPLERQTLNEWHSSSETTENKPGWELVKGLHLCFEMRAGI